MEINSNSVNIDLKSPRVSAEAQGKHAPIQWKLRISAEILCWCLVAEKKKENIEGAFGYHELFKLGDGRIVCFVNLRGVVASQNSDSKEEK
jgi:hypothetical protein